VVATKPKQALPFKRRSSYLAYPEDLHLEKCSQKKHYDPRVHNTFEEKVVRWMMVHGVQQAVAVEKAGDLCIVVDGRQRVINALEANRRLEEQGVDRRMIPVVPKRGDVITLFQIGVICNEHRRPENPVTQAYKMSKYMELGHNEDDCAELWDVTTRTVRNRLYLLELCEKVQRAVIEGTVTVGNAIKLRHLSVKDQVAALKAPKPERSKVRRPSKKKIARVLKDAARLPKQVRAAIEWVTGQITDEEAADQIKGLAVLVGPTEDPNQQGLFDE
jgi:ParB family chromosome partitioning protein